MKKISIIVPIYNVEKYVKKCIESLQEQTYGNIEIILVDDGSTDSSTEIIDEYANKDARIVAIHQKNKGVSAARNAGLKVACGEYIGFVDPDDYVECQMYEVMVNRLQANLADLAVCGYSKVWESSGKTEKYCMTDKIVAAKKCLNDLFDFRGGYQVKPCVWNKLFNREKIGTLQFDENLGISEDLKFVVQYILSCNTIVYVMPDFYKNLQRNGSITRSTGQAVQIIKTVEIDDFIFDSIKKVYPEISETVFEWIIQDNRGWHALVKKEDIELANKMKKAIMRKKWKILFSKIYWKEKIVMILGWF